MVRKNRMWHTSVAVLFLAICFLVPARVRAQEMVVGVNVVNPMRASVADQNALLGQLKAAHVRVIRCGISNDDKGIDFARRAAAQGIRIQLIVGPDCPPGATSRPYQPDVFPAMWGGHPLSYADPALSKAAFQRLFDSLDTNGIALAGVELGNEINWAAFNAEFPLPGEGKILSLRDLADDPEGKQIAKGFVQYIKVLAALKDVRDHSRLNRSTPIISAGLVSAKDGEKPYNTKKRASSKESVGDIRFGQFAKCMIQGDFGDVEGAEPIGFSHGEFGFVVQPCDHTAGELLFGAEVVQDQRAVGA